MKNFSERLSSLLSERGRGSASALAKHCRVATGYISQLASGAKTNPSLEIVARIADFFQVNVPWMISGEEPRLSAMPRPVLLDDAARQALVLMEAQAGAPFALYSEDDILDIITDSAADARGKRGAPRRLAIDQLAAAARELRSRQRAPYTS